MFIVDSVGVLSGGVCIVVCSLFWSWMDNVIWLIEVDVCCSVDIYLLCYLLFVVWCMDVDVELYFKDEMIYIIGSFKYWLVCLLFFYVLCNGWINENIMVVEVLLGLMVVFEVYFVVLLGLLFIVVMLVVISVFKIVLIEL